MADLSVTAANVIAASTVPRETVVAGETITQGMGVYKSSSDGKWYKSRANAVGTAPLEAMSLTAASLNQPLVVGFSGFIAIGATLEPGKIYVTSSGTAGQFRPVNDLVTGEFPSVAGVALSASIIDFRPISCIIAATGDVT
jgi:hypothetical protein